MERGGLELVFKIVGGAGSDGYTIWTSDGTAYDDPADMHPYKSKNHWMSAKLSTSWNSAGTYFNAIYANAYIGGREEAYLTFKTKGTDKLTWFGKSYLIDSSWTDLMAGAFVISKRVFVLMCINMLVLLLLLRCESASERACAAAVRACVRSAAFLQ